IIKRLSPEEANNPIFITEFLNKNPSYQSSGYKAIILAAGKSIRLYPYSQDLPKPLVPIGGQPVLKYIISSLKQYGIHDIVVVTGFQDQKIYEVFNGEVRFIYNPFFSVSSILASLSLAINEMDSPLLILYADILFDPTIIGSLMHDQNDISLAVSSSDHDTEAEEVIIENGTVIEIGKDILPSTSSVLEFAGIARFNQEGVRVLSETIEELSREEGFLDMKLPAIINRLIMKGHKIYTKTIATDYWIDIDLDKDVQRAEKEVLPRIQKKNKN
ncbi:MAG: phosphocholine cytidylyltransferase family protein, partial [Candidatus Hodarchaeales archaeon]